MIFGKILTLSIFMANIIAGIFVVFCTFVIFYSITVYKENCKLGPKKTDLADKDELGLRH